MYTDHALYYLNQIGIRPWIKKERANYKLVVIAPSKLSQKESALFLQMMHYLNLEKHEFCLHQPAGKGRIEPPTCALLLLGELSPDKIENLGCPVFLGPSLAAMLQDARQKKELFLILQTVHKLIHQ